MEYIMTELKIFKTNPEVVLPTFGTEQAACFDLAFQAYGKHEYTGFNAHNSSFTRTLREGKIILMPRDRIMVPTGLIFDIPEGYSIRIHPRSGLSYKQGLILANLEAVIDSDYVHETFVLLTNISENHITINNGDRVAQAELVKQEKYVVSETTNKPVQKTDRTGGLGSTGVATFPTIKNGRGRPKKNAV
jgi:dUTP pyrophosphatase